MNSPRLMVRTFLTSIRPYLSLIVTVVVTPLIVVVTDARLDIAFVLGFLAFCAVEIILLGDRVRGLARLSSNLSADTERTSNAAKQIELEAARLDASNRALQSVVEEQSAKLAAMLEIADIGNAFGRLKSNSVSLVASELLQRDIERLRAISRDAVQRGRYPVDVDSTAYDDLIFSQFTGEPGCCEFAATLVAENLSWFLQRSGQLFADRLATAVADGFVNEVRRVIVYSEPKQIESDIMRLYVLHHSYGPYKVRCLARSEAAEVIRRRTNAKHAVIDFGVHGTVGVWETRAYEDGSLTGFYVFGHEAVAQYGRVFEDLWNVADEIAVDREGSFASIAPDADPRLFRENAVRLKLST